MLGVPHQNLAEIESKGRVARSCYCLWFVTGVPGHGPIRASHRAVTVDAGAASCIAYIAIGCRCNDPSGRPRTTSYHRRCVETIGLSTIACPWFHRRVDEVKDLALIGILEIFDECRVT
jgi:hypothetical protein